MIALRIADGIPPRPELKLPSYLSGACRENPGRASLVGDWSATEWSADRADIERRSEDGNHFRTVSSNHRPTCLGVPMSEQMGEGRSSSPPSWTHRLPMVPSENPPLTKGPTGPTAQLLEPRP